MARGMGMLALLCAVLLMACAGAGAVAQTTPQAPPAQRVEYGKLFIVTYRPGPSWQAGRPNGEQGLGAHARYVQSLLDGGKLFAGGGFASEEGGLMIVRCATLSEAQAIVAIDPAVTAGVFVGQIEEWKPRFFGQGPLMIPISP